MAREEKLRIALVSTPSVAVPPQRYGGTELVVDALATGLAALGHEVTLFATGDSRAAGRVEALYPRAVWPPDSFAALAHAGFAAARLAAAPGAFDLVHAHLPEFLAFAPFIGAPLVYTLHHDSVPALSGYYRNLQAPPTYVAISRRQRELHPELQGCRVVPHGLDVGRYAAAEQPGQYLAFLGRLAEVKGPDVALEVAAALGRELRIGGGRDPGVGGPEFFDRVLHPRLSEPNVRWLGELSHEPKVALLAGAEALLFPVRWDEPFGLVMIEAMLCGCPVVAFPGGAVEEVVEPGVTGFIARNAAEMARLVREEVPLLDRRRIRARAVERFSREVMVGRYLSIYRDCIRKAQEQELASRPASAAAGAAAELV